MLHKKLSAQRDCTGSQTRDDTREVLSLFNRRRVEKHYEWATDAAMVAGTGTANGAPAVSKSHRPVHAFEVGGGAANAWDMDKAPPVSQVPVIRRNFDLLDGTGPAPTLNRLGWIGRVHGRAVTNAAGQDMRTTSFLYVDGHVENKRLAQTLYPEFQWGDKFYSLSPSNDMQTNQPTSGQIAKLK